MEYETHSVVSSCSLGHLHSCCSTTSTSSAGLYHFVTKVNWTWMWLRRLMLSLEMFGGKFLIVIVIFRKFWRTVDLSNNSAIDYICYWHFKVLVLYFYHTYVKKHVSRSASFMNDECSVYETFEKHSCTDKLHFNWWKNKLQTQVKMYLGLQVSNFKITHQPILVLNYSVPPRLNIVWLLLSTCSSR